MLKRLAERDIRHAGATAGKAALAEEALRILYQRKAFRGEPAWTNSATPSASRHHRHAGARPAAGPAHPNRPDIPPTIPAAPSSGYARPITEMESMAMQAARTAVS